MIVYKFLSERWGIDNLKRKRLKASTLEDLNDPFEFNTIVMDHPFLRSLWAELRAGLFGHSGFLCFSKNWRNPVIWSHYAENHQGLALGFEVPDSKLLRVNYRKTPLRLSKQTKSDPNSVRGMAELERALLAAASTKFKHWEYEQELRCIDRKKDLVRDGPMYFKPFGDELVLKEVVFGAKTKLRSSDIRPLVKNDVRIVTSRLAFQSFSVVRQRAVSRQR